MRHKKIMVLLGVTAFLLILLNSFSTPVQARWSDYYQTTDQLTANAYNNIDPAIAVDPRTGYTHMTYTSITPGTNPPESDIYYINSSGTLGFFEGDEALISTTSYRNHNSDVAVDKNGTVHIVFVGIPNGAIYDSHQVMYTNNSRGVFSSPIPVSWSLNNNSKPQVEVDENITVHIMWQQKDEFVNNNWHIAYMNLTKATSPSNVIGFTYTTASYSGLLGSKSLSHTIDYWDAYPGDYPNLVPMYTLPGYALSAGGQVHGGMDLVNLTTEFRTVHNNSNAVPASSVNISYYDSPTGLEWAATKFFLQEDAYIPQIGLPLANYQSDSGGGLEVLITEGVGSDENFTGAGIRSNTTIFPVTTNGTWKYINTNLTASTYLPGGNWYFVVVRGTRVTQESTYVLWATNSSIFPGNEYYTYTRGDVTNDTRQGSLGLQLEVHPVNATHGLVQPNTMAYTNLMINGSTVDGSTPYNLAQDQTINITLNRSATLNLDFSIGFQFLGGYSITYNGNPNFAFTADATDVQTALITVGGVITLRCVFIYDGNLTYFETDHTTGFSQWVGFDLITGGDNADPYLALRGNQVFVAVERGANPSNVWVINSTDPLGAGFDTAVQVTQNTLVGQQSYDPAITFTTEGIVELVFVNRTTTDADYRSELLVTNNNHSYFTFFDNICDDIASNNNPMRYFTPLIASGNGTVNVFYVSQEKYPTWLASQVNMFSYTFVYNSLSGGSQFLQIEENTEGSYIFESLDISYGAMPSDIPIAITIEDLFSGVSWRNVTTLLKEGSSAAPPEDTYYHKITFWNETEYFISNGTYRLTISNSTTDNVLMRVLVDGTHIAEDTGVDAYLVDQDGGLTQLNYSIGYSSGANMVCVEWQWLAGRVSFTTTTDQPHKVRSGEFNPLNNIDWYDLEMEAGLYYNFTISETSDESESDYVTLGLFNESVRLANLDYSISSANTNNPANRSNFVYLCEKTGTYYLMARKNLYNTSLGYQINFDQLPRLASLVNPKNKEIHKSFYKLSDQRLNETAVTPVTLSKSSKKTSSSITLSAPFVSMVEFYTDYNLSLADIEVTLKDQNGVILDQTTVLNEDITFGGWTQAIFGLNYLSEYKPNPLENIWVRKANLEFELVGSTLDPNLQVDPNINLYRNGNGELLIRSYSNLYLEYMPHPGDLAFTMDYLDHYKISVSTSSSFTSSVEKTFDMYYWQVDGSSATIGYFPIGEVDEEGVPVGLNLTGGYEYYWKVQAVDIRGNVGNWTAPRSFIIDNVVPNAPVLKNLAVFTTEDKVSLTWEFTANDVFGVKYFNVFMGDEPNFTPDKSTNMITSTNEVTTTKYTVEDLYTDAYYFKITAVDFAGWESVVSNEVWTQLVVAGGEVSLDIVKYQKFAVQLGDHLEFEVTNVISDNKDSKNRYYLTESTMNKRIETGSSFRREPVTYLKGTRLHFWIKKIDTTWVVPVWAEVWFKGPDEAEFSNLDSVDLFPSILYVINSNTTYQFEVLKSWLRHKIPQSSVLYALNYSGSVNLKGSKIDAISYTFWEVVEGDSDEKTSATFVYDKTTGALLEMYLYNRYNKEGYSLKLVDTSLDLTVMSTWQEPTLFLLVLVGIVVVTAFIVKKLEA